MVRILTIPFILIKFIVKQNSIEMKTLTIEIPDSVNEQEVKMQLASQLFAKGILSSGQAADLVGISKREFIESVGKYGVSIFGETPGDLKKIMDE